MEIEPYETAHARIAGYVSAPGNERGDRRLQLAFVNSRLLAHDAICRRLERRVRHLCHAATPRLRRAVRGRPGRRSRSERSPHQIRRSLPAYARCARCRPSRVARTLGRLRASTFRALDLVRAPASTQGAGMRRQWTSCSRQLVALPDEAQLSACASSRKSIAPTSRRPTGSSIV